MSGVELVAVLSIGASVVAVIDACNKLVDRIKEYRGSAAFVPLRSQLQLFTCNIKSLDKITNYGCSTDEEEQLLKEVLQGCKVAIEELEDLISSLLPEPTASTFKKIRCAARSFLKDHKVRAALEDLDDYQKTILFYLGSNTNQNVREALFLLEEQKQNAALQMPAISINGEALLPNSSQDPFSALYQRRQQHSRDVDGCVFENCRCFCHRQLTAKEDFWFLTGFSSCRCDGNIRYVVSTTILRKLFQVSLAASWSNGLSVASSFKFRNVVRKDNPGFRMIDQCLWEGKTFEETRAGLVALRDSGIIDFDDSTKDGEGYLELLWGIPVGYGEQEMRNARTSLARFLAGEGVSWKKQHLHAHYKSSLGPQGPDVEFLRCLPALPGLDVTTRPFEFFGALLSSDPFFLISFTQFCTAQIGTCYPIIMLRLWTNHKQDFGQYKPLHTAVALGSVDEVQRLVKRKHQPDLSQNLFGHTVLHLATKSPFILKLLLENGYRDAVDFVDSDHATPLSYALCYGCLESIDILVNAGSSIPKLNPIWGFLHYWGYAASACDETPFIRLLDHYIRKVGPTSVISDVLEPLIFTTAEPGPWNVKAVKHLLSEIEKRSNFYSYEFQRGGLTPLHMAMTPEHARVLLDFNGFDINASSDQHGETALMRYTWFLDPQLIQDTLSRGVKVNSTDRWGRNALHYTFARSFSHHYSHRLAFHEAKLIAIMRVVAVLTAAGGDFLQRDKCRCFCSPHGCSPLRAFIPASFPGPDHHMIHIWFLEIFRILQACGESKAIELLTEEIDQIQRADEVGITHTCCSSRYSKVFFVERARYHQPLLQDHCEFEKMNDNWEEIREEEGDLKLQLDEDCLSGVSSWKSQLVSIVARRCVMMESIEEQRLRGSHVSDPTARLGLESCVEKYVAGMENVERHLVKVLPKFDDTDWVQERKSLLKLLLEEVHRVRRSKSIKGNWDIENWIEGTALNWFEITPRLAKIWLTFQPIERI